MGEAESTASPNWKAALMPDQLRDDMREERKASGIPWTRFAREAGFDAAHLRSVENGRRSVTAAVAAAYDQVLGTGDRFATALQERTALGRGALPWDQAGTMATFTRLLDGSSVVGRGFLTDRGRTVRLSRHVVQRRVRRQAPSWYRGVPRRP